MACAVPETIPRSATAGERILFESLRDHLPSDYIVYYEPEIRGRRPDFVIIGPDLGLVILEVKDYTKGTLYQINHDEWTLRNTAGEFVKTKSPLKQARDNARLITDHLKKDKNLVQGIGSHLKFPYGYGTVFTRLKQEDFINHNLYQVIEPQFVLCRDEIDPDEDSFSPEILMDKIRGIFTVWNRRKDLLTSEDIQAIRFHLFPEVRISAEFKPPINHQDQLLLSLYNIKTMDLHQENMAKQLCDKHRLIRGVAGSGKTLVLASRAKMLAKAHPDWKILVLCYGIPLSRNLKQMIQRMMREPEDLFDLLNSSSSDHHANTHVEVYNFHEWLRNSLKMKDSDIPALLDKVNKKEAILPIYDAVMIDEGQDFEADWLKLLSCCLNPDTQSLLLVEDRAQSIFKRKTSLAQDIGLDFRGRSKILSINYRNTAQIVQFAWDFYQEHSRLKNKVQEASVEGVEIIPPQSTKRKGPEPMIKSFRNIQEEMNFVSKSITFLHREKNIPIQDMAILYRVKNNHHTSYIDEIKNSLTQHELAYTWITESAESKRNFIRDEHTVKISTIDSAKGLDFRVVFIINVENMPFPLEEVEEREVSLFYIRMTRALEWLFLTYSGESKFTKYLDSVGKQRSQQTSSQLQSG
ncbi:3'-5' exonuclease [Paenibacillus validus]|uniref:3'-5' exonuclease n=1 Tax=Paenibacillus validus TaxID=44253 RepID=UPI000FDCC3D5|nr:nuclease-related domain-containing DEAD/DEAH box helicase [Paenibacillus validus]MED4599804.1 3'-5' exonuclease [Paenibacillus validus]MED4604666.1 3'-5' exonuclease [Paenibacillus validus]